MTNCFFLKSTHAIITLQKSVKLHYQHDMMTYNPIVNATESKFISASWKAIIHYQC